MDRYFVARPGTGERQSGGSERPSVFVSFFAIACTVLHFYVCIDTRKIGTQRTQRDW